MPLIDIADDTFVRRASPAVAAVVADPRSWRAWWPNLELTVTRDRGVKGQQWAVRGLGSDRRPVAGTQEIWLEPWGDGVVVHLFVRLDPLGPAPSGRWLRRERDRVTRAWKRCVHALKDELERSADPAQGVGPSSRSVER